jgi:hypothetical protein
MRRSTFIKFILIVSLVWVGSVVSIRGNETPAGEGEGESSAAGRAQFALITVNGRPLTGPNSAARRHDGRILVPVVSVVRALGDEVAIDAAARSVSIRRQTGATSDFDARLGHVRENGSLILTVSNLGEIVFPPNPDEVMLPAEIVASLVDVSIRYESDKNTVMIARGFAETVTGETRDHKSPVELHRLDYEYSFNRYSGAASQNLNLTAAGRLGDGRFSFLSNSAMSSMRGVSLRNGTFSLERPNGQRFLTGDFGTGANLQFLSTNLRGGAASIPVSGTVVTAFAGRTYSGVMPITIDPLLPNPAQLIPRRGFRYDTSVFGVFATTEPAVFNRPKPLNFSAGVLRFSGADRSGNVVTGSVNYSDSRFRLQGDLGYGKFAGIGSDNSRIDGNGTAVDIAGSFQINDDLAVQARFAHIGTNFLSPQAGQREPISLKTASVNWSPKSWLSASVTASMASSPRSLGTQDNKYITAAFAITPNGGAPRVYFSHTQNSTSQVRSAAFTMLTASKEFSRLRLFLNATRTRTLGPANMNAQLGASYAINDSNSIEFSQGAGSGRALNGQFDWRTSNLLGGRLSFSAGAGYNHDRAGGFSTFERLSGSMALPRGASLQLSYIQTTAGPTMLVSLRGSLFRKREGRAFLDASLKEMNSFGNVSGRIYQDVDLNGRYDAGTDKPQAEVKVRIDGNRYVVSDQNGLYRFDSVSSGAHRVYLDLLSVRADLTVLDGDARNMVLSAGRDSLFEFRLVRTGRITGRAWLDTNENGKFDEGETPLADVRVTTASGRDTLTDSEGFFTIGDLPPGEHIVLLDEKTVPEKTIAGSKPQAVQVLPGQETGDTLLPVIMVPAEVKRFGASRPTSQ